MSEVLQPHPLADAFPPIPATEFAELVQSIRDNGLRRPVQLYEGKILDGRHRYAACLEAGVVPSTEPFAGDDPVAFVVDMNARRRNMTPGQKAAVAAELLPHLEAEAAKRVGGRPRKDEKPVASLPRVSQPSVAPEHPKSPAPKSRDAAAKAVGASARNVQVAKALKEEEPGLFDWYSKNDGWLPGELQGPN